MMKGYIVLSIFLIVSMLFILSPAVNNASADAILFPYVAASNSVVTIASVVNTDVKNELYIRYFYKPTSLSHTSTCGLTQRTIDTSQNDIVSFEVNGFFEDTFADTTGGPLFNDPASNVSYLNDNFTMGPLSVPRRAFLIVDDNDNNGENLYGEAILMETNGGAAWGYRAYNPANDTGYWAIFDATDPALPGVTNDVLGEALDSSNNTDEAPVTLLPAYEWMTLFFVTPLEDTNQHMCTDCNVYINLTRDSGGVNTGVYDRDENPLVGSNYINVVCVSGVSLSEILPASVLAVVGVEGGWGYFDVDAGSGTSHNEDAAVVMKLEYNMVNYISPLFSNSFTGLVNTAVWIRNRDNIQGVSGF
jgi:hypothetical protein